MTSLLCKLVFKCFLNIWSFSILFYCGQCIFYLGVIDHPWREFLFLGLSILSYGFLLFTIFASRSRSFSMVTFLMYYVFGWKCIRALAVSQFWKYLCVFDILSLKCFILLFIRHCFEMNCWFSLPSWFFASFLSFYVTKLSSQLSVKIWQIC